jgi:hypothetical protein
MSNTHQGSFNLKDVKETSSLPEEVDAVMSAYLDNTLKGVLIDFKTGNVMINTFSNGMETTIYIVKKTNKCIYSLVFNAA